MSADIFDHSPFRQIIWHDTRVKQLLGDSSDLDAICNIAERIIFDVNVECTESVGCSVTTAALLRRSHGPKENC